ncbi:MAG TPA: PTS sugar transporter subunit IIC [Gemmatimonadales bacterium]|nr:PTS sugar transporter subunit IIC [Gemmatimonadales bacterium]
MTSTSVALLLAWGMVVGLDLISIPQIMIARPLVAGTVAGALAGDPLAGALVGVLLELFALEILPVGAARYPDYGPAAVAGAATAAGVPTILGLGLAGLVGLVMAFTGEWSILVLRRRNTADVRRNAGRLDVGDPAAVRGVHARCIARDALRALLLTAVGLVLAALVHRWAFLSVRTSVLLLAVLVGVALSTGAAGALRLAHGQRRASLWFLAGLAVGIVLVVWR